MTLSIKEMNRILSWYSVVNKTFPHMMRLQDVRLSEKLTVERVCCEQASVKSQIKKIK